MLVAAKNNIPIYTYAPAKVKRSVTDHGGSDKEQIQRMVCIHLNLPETPQPSDAADALAIALCHIQERRLARLLTKGT
jgi:crossover junction endodeoxyribonuclease RuvC